jgi:membrane protease YdiL (CAAX protease family)
MSHLTTSMRPFRPAPSTTDRNPSGVRANALVGLVALGALPAAFVAARWIGQGCSGVLALDVWNLLILLVLAPVIEETALRLGLQQWLRQFLVGRPASTSRLMEIGISTAIFTALHFGRLSGALFLLYAIPGLALAALYRWRSSLPINVLIHAWFNLLALGACSLNS